MHLIKASSCIVLFLCIYTAKSVSAFKRQIVNFEGDFNKAYLNAVNRDIEFIYNFELPDNFEPLHTKIQIMLTTDERTTRKFPLLATIIQTHEATSLRLPYDNRASNYHLETYLNASRTLCIHSDDVGVDEKHFAIRIITSSNNTVFFELRVLKQDAMKIELNVPVTIKISPTTPDFFYFQFNKTAKSKEVHVKVKVTSPDQTCCVLSIQPALCPVPDHAENVKVAGTQSDFSKGWEWETLSTKGAIVTSDKLISTPGFFVALLVTKDDKQCGHLIDESQDDIKRIANLTLIVELDQVIDYNYFWKLPVLYPLILNFGILFLCGFVCIITQLCHTREKILRRPELGKCLSDVSLSDFSGKCVEKKNRIHSTDFGKMVIVIAIFFSIPVFELTSYNLTVLHITGDNDICYYNSFCSHPLGYLKDFNHLWSNMGYIIFGFGFIIITYLKKKCSRNEIYAIPFHTGLYYSMGLALVMEGFMSAAYHICPNKSNFQYDTCFMYIIAAMCILKIFDFRHPRILGPNAIFTVLALFSLISASGIILERYQINGVLILRVCITIIHIYVIALFSVYTLYVGYPIKTKGQILTSTKDIPKCLLIFPNFCKWKMFKIRLHRITSVILFWIANIYVSMDMWSLDFATGLLRFLIVNLIYYLLHYVIIKLLVHQEFQFKCTSFRSYQPLVYFIATIALGFVSFLYFKIDLTEWRKSAAYSREGNDECILWDFYDEHDIWHMLSSLAILSLYMTLLTLDDGVQDICGEALMLI